jgi:hypothetical protein
LGLCAFAKNLISQRRKARKEKPFEMPRYFVQGGGEVRLDRSDFKAQGGEGAIYVKGAHAYKIFTDPRRAIPPAKISELSVITRPNIIRPLGVLLDDRNRAVGYSMRSVGKSYALCQLFPKAFRQRHNLTPDTVLRLVRRLQEGVAHVHAAGILVVDLNEMNFLVAEDFSEMFFIDVDSYRTPSFPATALMESVRDRAAREFNDLSDWFSFAVVSFQMFAGIHLFKGTYAPLQNLPDNESKLDARMRAGVSVLNAQVSVPASALPFNVIPPAYLDWYRAVFEEGKRLPPPADARFIIKVVQTAARGSLVSSLFEIIEAREFDGEIIRHDGVVTVTQSSVYFDGRKFPKPHRDVLAAATPRLRHLVAAYADASGPRFHDLTAGRRLDLKIDAEDVMLHGGQFYVRQGEHIYAVEFVELKSGIIPGLKPVANVMMKSTRTFEGLALQNLLGAYYASLLPAGGACYQVRLSELDGYAVVDARLERNVLVAVGAKGGRYDKFVFRFADDFGSYDLRILSDVSSNDINFTVLDTGVVLHMTDEDALEVFSRHEGSTEIKSVRDESVGGDVKLFHVGTRALMARGNKLYKISMRQQPGYP